MLETVERESPVARAISARLARPRSRSALMTRPRFSSLSERSDPESDDSTEPDPDRPGSVCQEYGLTPSKKLNNCQDSGQSQHDERPSAGRVIAPYRRKRVQRKVALVFPTDGLGIVERSLGPAG